MEIRKLLALLLTSCIVVPAFAQSALQDVQRNTNQQKRIEAGLQTGAITTGEAARLEKEQARVDRAESAAMRDGKLSVHERERVANLQNRASRDIRAASNNSVTGDPRTASSKRMQADVARNVKQEQRIENGLKDGSLTRREAARLEGGQARTNQGQAIAGRDGHINAREQSRVRTKQDRQSGRISKERHDRQNRG